MSNSSLTYTYELATDNIMAYIYANDSANFAEIMRYVFSDMAEGPRVLALLSEMKKLGWISDTSGRYRLTEKGEERRIS